MRDVSPVICGCVLHSNRGHAVRGWNAWKERKRIAKWLASRVIGWRFLLLAIVVTSCRGRDEAPPQPPGGPKVADPDYELMSASEVVPLRTEMLGSIHLGASHGETPIGLSRVSVSDSRITVLDEAGRTIRGYTRSGRLLFTTGFGRQSGLDLREPVAVAVQSDTTLVLDLDGNIAVLNALGHQTKLTRTRLPSSTVDYVINADTFIIATITKDSAIASGSAAILWRVLPDGGHEILGCHPDKLYSASITQKGMFQAFRFFGVSAVEQFVYCRQPLTPLVQIVDTRTKSTRYLRRAPPFYKRPADIPETTNQARVDDLRSRWTEHARFIPLPSGFVSFYTTFDKKNGRDRYLIFMCDSASRRAQCGTANLEDQPLDFLPPDTLLVANSKTSPPALKALSVYRIHF